MPTPLELYQQKVLAQDIERDEQQLAVLPLLNAIHGELTRWHLFKPKIRGLYLWGGVGIGKTFLMDLLSESLHHKKVLRLHFHQFMHRVHAELRELQGQRDPLKIIAKKISKTSRLLCFDECFVSDIGDAMLMAELFKALVDYHVCLVMTSNTAPDGLYQHGLQRSRFLPAIELMKKDMAVVHMLSTVDYRFRHLQEEGVFYSPLNDVTQSRMEAAFNLFAKDAPVVREPLVLYDRPIEVIARNEHVAWFDFKALCSVPRSQEDYLVIAKMFPIILIGNISQLHADHSVWRYNFTKLIDVLYDAHVPVLFSSAVSLDELYASAELRAEFSRTFSRLVEMRGGLLGKAH